MFNELGTRLIISHIAAELGTSLTPVREALTSLTKDNLAGVLAVKPDGKLSITWGSIKVSYSN